MRRMMDAMKRVAMPDRGRPVHGGLMGRGAILNRVDDIFDPDTFLADNLRGAAYDLRLARDFLILSDGTAYGPKQEHAE